MTDTMGEIGDIRRERQARRGLKRYALRLRKSRKSGEGYYIIGWDNRSILPKRVGYPDHGSGVSLETVETFLSELPERDFDEIRKHLPETYGVMVTGYHPDVGSIGDLLDNIAYDLPRQLAETIAATLSDALPEHGDIRVVWIEEEIDGYEVRVGDEIVYHVVNAIES